MVAIDVLYDEPPCLVINKPGGLLTQSPPGIDSLECQVRTLLQRQNPPGARLYVGVPHRLDRPASGAILLVRSARATRRIAAQFEARQVEKIYWVLTQGVVTPSEGTWHDFMRKVPDEPRAEIVPADHPDAKSAVLHYRVLHGGPSGSWLEVRLQTGRTHQIRVQCASRGHAVWGDQQYGSTIPFGPPCADWRDRWIALHARSLGFVHPHSRQHVTVTAPLPQAWQTLTEADAWGFSSV